ncbi:hypothetical protein A4G16_01675 [Mannheimia granulomatis]|uniref:N-acetylneuraminyllactose-binding fibrillar hemagglutinin receptor-binding subunit n=1 Tax=Mannheimia granulomatis TaxID=85402 RepID=A0A6G8JGM9_9PAST|nr:hypothetical protein [Mannheimia granulomatis]QIM66174.1 hypothetical protein A4G16_01675 [Mannheimia granulomatis]
MKNLIIVCGLFLVGCTNPEMQQRISNYQTLINNSKEVTVFYNSQEFQEVKVEESKASENKKAGILPYLISLKIDDIVTDRNKAKSNKYTINFNEKLKGIYEKNSMNTDFTNAFVTQLKTKGYDVKVIEANESSIEKDKSQKGLKIFLHIETGYLSPPNSLLFEPNRVVNYQVMHDSNILSLGKVGGVGGWLGDKYTTYEKLSADAENARNIIKKYLMEEVDSTVKQVLTIGSSNIQ